MQGCSEMIPIDTIFLLLKIYFITCFISVIFLMLVMAKIVVIFTEFLHIGKSLIYVLLVSLLAYKQELEDLQSWTKPVETNRENAYFFLSSWQKLKPPPNECPISPLPLIHSCLGQHGNYTCWFLDQKDIFEQGVGKGPAYFFCLEKTGVGRKSQKIDGIVSTVLSGVLAFPVNVQIIILSSVCLLNFVLVNVCTCLLKNKF